MGHRDTPNNIKPKLEKMILQLQGQGVKCFYVGNNGGFDALVQVVLAELSKKNKSIKYYIVTSYFAEPVLSEFQEKSIFPEGLELVHPKIAIVKRNEWLLNNSSYLIAYVKNSHSNAHRIIEKAKKKGLTIINLANE